MATPTMSYDYPIQGFHVVSAESAFEIAYSEPPGVGLRDWPPLQVSYLEIYLQTLECQTVVLETHYIDSVFMHDNAVYYARSFRSYPNYTKRLHFFKSAFDEAEWRNMLRRAATGEYSTIQTQLQEQYLGFSIVRPLPGSPVGRTVLPALSEITLDETKHFFGTTRRHCVHVAGFSLFVDGVPFQSQDQGVSACATTALWSALDGVAAKESMTVSSPASITESATRYPLQEGRPFPNEGLTVRQICEATRTAGFSPLVIHGNDVQEDALQIYAYCRSGFSPVLALLPVYENAAGHAVCCVGFHIEQITPQTNPKLAYQDASTALKGIYIHDDRLGPYAYADLSPLTDSKTGNIRTCISIRWPDEKPDETWLLHAIVVPVPQKLRLTVSRLRRVGLVIAQAIGMHFGDSRTVLDSRFEASHVYMKELYNFGLSEDGLYQAACGMAFSRYIGLVEITGSAGPILDIIIDSTETNSETAVLACIRRSGFPDEHTPLFEAICDLLGAEPIT